MNHIHGSHPDFKRYVIVGLTVSLGLILVGALWIGTLSVARAQTPVDGETLPDTLHLGMPPASMGMASADASADAAAVLPSLEPPVAPITLPNPVWRLGVVTDGLYALDYDTLAAAGVPVTTTDPMSLHVTWRGQPVSLDRSDLADGTWHPGDALIVYGEKFHGSAQDEKYTDENVYWLSVAADTVPPAMTARSVAPTVAPPALGCTVTTALDDNVEYWARHTHRPGTATTWFWKQIPSVSFVTETVTLSVDAPVTGRGGTLVVEVAPEGKLEHTMRLALNGTVIADQSWWGKVGRVVTAPVPAGLLQDGDNEIGIFLDELVETVYLDRIELTYVREPGAVDGTARCRVPVTANATYTFTGTTADTALYDVTDPLHPIRLEGAQASAGQLVFSDDASEGTRYVAEVPRQADLTRYEPDLTLLSPTAGADELIVAPDHFRTALQPLIDHREAQGLRVKFAAVEDIYPLFNGGVFHPEAIRSLVAYAYHHWPGDPLQYLFLVGDGHFNLKGYNPATYGAYTPVWVPPYMAFDDPDQGEVPVDSRFGDIMTETINSETGYLLPEVYVGRISAQDVAQVTGYVTKVLRYEQTEPQIWNSQALLVADNGKQYDEGYDAILNNLYNEYFRDYLAVDKVYMETYCLIDPDDPYADCPTATQALTESWNAGGALLVYAGHGSIHRWAHEPLIFNTQLAALTQTEKLPFLLSMDCWDGNWFFPPSYPGVRDTRSIGEWTTVVLTETGAIAAFGPSALAYSGLEDLLAQGIFGEIFNQGERRLGPITQAGREKIADTYLGRTYTLLGDPATRLNIRRAVNLGVHLEVTPTLVFAGDAMTYTLTYSNTGEFTATEGRISLTLSSWLTDTAYSLSHSSMGTSAAVSDERYVWNVGTITPGGFGHITVTARVKPELSGFGVFTQEVEINTQTPEANAGNNSRQAIAGVAHYEIDAGPQTQSAGGLRGGSVTYPITIANNGYPANTVSLSAVGPTWSTSINPSSISVPSMETRTITATVTIPPSATPDQTHTVSIRAEGTGSFAEVELRTEVHHGIYLPLVTR